MTQTQNSLPKWILIVSALVALMEIGGSIFMCLSPESMADSVDVAARGVSFILCLWSVRQFALGVIFAYATFRKSAQMLSVCYLFFLVMFVGDLVLGVVQHETNLIVSAAVMSLIGAGMLYAVNRPQPAA
jgi:hypothetical protein